MLHRLRTVSDCITYFFDLCQTISSNGDTSARMIWAQVRIHFHYAHCISDILLKYYNKDIHVWSCSEMEDPVSQLASYKLQLGQVHMNTNS